MPSRLVRLLLWVPSRVRKEFRTRGGDYRFLMWISFLAAFLWARVWVFILGPRSPTLEFHDAFQIGSKMVILGYHPHHIALGILLLAVAGWLGLSYRGRQVNRVAALLYGGGLGLIVDEIGFVVEGITYRHDVVEVFILVVAVSALMMSSLYFPSFWDAVGRRLMGWLRLRRKPASRTVPLRPPEDPLSPVASPAPVAADETAPGRP